MNVRKIYIGCALVGILAGALCTKVDYSNPIDSDGSNYISGICSSPECCDSATAITSKNIAAYYDTTSTWYQNHKGRILQHSTPVIDFKGGTPPGTDSVIIAQNDPNHVLGTLNDTAYDPLYGSLMNYLTVVGDTFYASRCSTYVVVYSVTNPAGDRAQKTRYVIVDCSAPQLTLLGANPDSIQIGVVYHDPGATAVDNIDGTITSKIQITPATIGTSAAVTDTVTYSVSDRAGNIATAQRVVVVYKPLVKDTIPPVITLKGANPMNIAKNAVYTEPGATALDNIDGDISNKIIISGTVNTSVANTYTLYYNVSDNAGNAAVTKTRTVIVAGGVNPGDSLPVITLIGKNPDSVKVGTGTYTDPGYSAIDPKDGDITASVKITDIYGSPITISLGVAGVYTLEYSVTDKEGHSASVTRIVYVVGVSTDKTPPVITLTGAASCTLAVGAAYVDPGATAIDDVDGIITSKIKAVLTTAAGVAASMTTFTNTVGPYIITYTVSDAAGNAATPAIRHILVEDTTGMGASLTKKYGVPLATPLPSINTAYKTITVDGKGPSMSTVTTFSLNWDLPNKGLNQFSFNYNVGPTYYSNFSPSQNFAQANPQFTLNGSGVTGLDGSYYITATTAQCVWVKTDGSFAIVFKP